MHWAYEPPYADAGGYTSGEAPSVTVVEMALTPWDDLDFHGAETSRRSRLEAGRSIGVPLTVRDIDGFVDGLPASSGYSLVEPVDSDPGLRYVISYSENAAAAELLPCFTGDCSRGETAVAPSSWGRIKAGLR